MTITNTTTNKTIKRTVKKNVLTVKNLAPGNYTSSYNAQLKKGRKVLARTAQSPSASFQIN